MLKQRKIAVAVLLLLAVLWLPGSNSLLPDALAQVNSGADNKVPGVLPAAKGDQCVADTELMRKNHMDMLNHQRDETVVDGIRGNRFSLVGCVNCHAQRDADNNPVRVDAEGQFCQSCHAFAAVQIDCFSCHAAVPDTADEVIGHLENQPRLQKQSMISASIFAAPAYVTGPHSLFIHLSDQSSVSDEEPQ